MSNYGHLPQQIAAPVGAFPVGTPMHMVPAMYLQYGQGQAAPSPAPAPGAHLPQALSAPQLAGGLMPPPPPPPQQVPQHISQQMGVPQQLPQQIPPGMPQQLPQGMPQVVPQGVPQGVLQGMPQQLPQEGQRQQHFQYAQPGQQRQHYPHPPPQSPLSQQPPHLQAHHQQHSPVLGAPLTPLPAPPQSGPQPEAYQQQHLQHGSPQSQQPPLRSPHNNSRSHMSPARHTPQPHYSVQVPIPVKGYPGPPMVPQHKSQSSPHVQHQPSPHPQSQHTNSPHQQGPQQPLGPHTVSLPPGVSAYMPQQMLQMVPGGMPQMPQALQQRVQEGPLAQSIPPGSVPPPSHGMASSGVSHQGIPPPGAPPQWYPQAMSPGMPHSMQHPGMPPGVPQGTAQSVLPTHSSMTTGVMPPQTMPQNTQHQGPPPGYGFHHESNGYMRPRSPSVSSQAAPRPQATPQPVNQGSPHGAPAQPQQISVSQGKPVQQQAHLIVPQAAAQQQTQRRHSNKHQTQFRGPEQSSQSHHAAPPVRLSEESQASLQQTGDLGQRVDAQPSGNGQASSPRSQGLQQPVTVPGAAPGGEVAEQSTITPLVRELEQLTGETWADIGRLAEAMGQYPTGVQCLELALKYQVFSVPLMHSLASCYRQVGDFGSAIEAYRTVLQHQPDNGDAWAALGHCYLRGDDLPKSYQAHQQAFYHREGREPQFWYGLGILYDRYGSLEYAEEALIQVLKIDKHFDKATEVYFRLGLIYKQQNRLDLALKVFEYILNDPPTPLTVSDIWFQIGNVHEQRQAFTDACDAYEQVLKGDANHAKVLQQLGWLYHQQTKHETALKYLTRSLEADPSDSQSWYLLGRCYMSQTKYQRAYEAYQQAVYRDARNPTFWCSIGVLYYQISQYRDALDAYSRAIGLNPYISEAWYDLGMLYESCSNHTSDALYAYQRAARLDPENEQIKARIDHLKQQDQEESGSQQSNTSIQPTELPNVPPREPHVKFSQQPPTTSLNGAALLPESLINMVPGHDNSTSGQKPGDHALPVQPIQPIKPAPTTRPPQPVQPLQVLQSQTSTGPYSQVLESKEDVQATNSTQEDERADKRKRTSSIEEVKGEANGVEAVETASEPQSNTDELEMVVETDPSESRPVAKELPEKSVDAANLELGNGDASEPQVLQGHGDEERRNTDSQASSAQSVQNSGPVREEELVAKEIKQKEPEVSGLGSEEAGSRQAEVIKGDLKETGIQETALQELHPAQTPETQSSTSQESHIRENISDMPVTNSNEDSEPKQPDVKATDFVAETAKIEDKLAPKENGVANKESPENSLNEEAALPAVQPGEKRASTESPPPAKRQLVEEKGRDIDEDEDYD